jgi:hypothetical protein
VIYKWAREYAPTTFADYYVDHRYGGLFYIGFTEDQDAFVAAFERRFPQVPANRIEPFPFQPKHSARELRDTEEAILDDKSLWGLITNVGSDARSNLVEVGTLEVEKLTHLLAERLGPDAPIRIVHEPPGELLAAFANRR